MRKEFPIDKWLRIHMTPIRSLVALVIFMAVIIITPNYLSSSTISNIYFLLMGSICVFVLGMLIWHIIWQVKYPFKAEFCKECGGILPEKFEE